MTEDITGRPNAARMYDYMLGGSHNFEADRVATERLTQLIPSVINGARLNRWFMFDAIQRLSALSLNCYLDLATGLPTEGYIHTLLPAARVVYNDIDPATVAYGREVVGENPNVVYLQANIAINLESILTAADDHFTGERKIGICLIGVSYFLNEDQLHHVLHTVYDWCAPGSHVALSWLMMPEVHDPNLEQFLGSYKAIGVDLYGRTPEQISALLGRWQVVAPGILPLNDWNGVGNWLDPNDSDRQGTVNLYGCIARKE